MKAVILAAGEGTRLRPLTNDICKCLVELKGQPLLAYQLSVLRSGELDEIVLVGGYKAEKLSPYGLKTHHNERYAQTNMVHSLFAAESDFDDDLIIAYGDIIYEPRVLRALLSSTADFSVIVDTGWQSLWHLRMEDPLADAESMRIDERSQITELGRKAAAVADIQGQYIGLLKVRKHCLSRLSAYYHGLDRNAMYEGRTFDKMFMTAFIQSWIDRGEPVTAVPVNHGWLEVDTLTDLNTYESLPEQGPLFDFRSTSFAGSPT